MKPLQPTKLASACAAALLTGGLLLHVSPAMAATAAGTQIKNLATVTYQDESGNTYSAQSNEAIIPLNKSIRRQLVRILPKLPQQGRWCIPSTP
jgi:hypothetical protein